MRKDLYTYSHRHALDRKVQLFVSLTDSASVDDKFQRVFTRPDVLFMVDYWCDSTSHDDLFRRAGKKREQMWINGGAVKYALTWVLDKCNMLVQSPEQRPKQCWVNWFVVPEGASGKTDFAACPVVDHRGGRWHEVVNRLMEHYRLDDNTVTPRSALRKAIAAKAYLTRAYAELSGAWPDMIDQLRTHSAPGWPGPVDGVVDRAIARRAAILEMPHMAYDLSVDVLDRILSGV